MWTSNLNNNLWCLNVQSSNCEQSIMSNIKVEYNTRQMKSFISTKRLKNRSVFNQLSLFNIMFIWSLIIGLLLSPTVLCQEEESGEEATTPPDTAELVLEEGNPCKTNPCGNGVCLQDKEK